MRRETKIERARKLREEDPQRWTYEALGKRFGVSGAAVQKWLNPERTREQQARDNAKRTATKRDWRGSNRAVCPECGAPMCAGSRCPSARPKCCRDCERSRRAALVAERAEAIVNWWGEGLTQKEIAQRLGVSVNQFGTELYEFRKKGYDLPYRRNVHPTSDGHPRFPEQVAA